MEAGCNDRSEGYRLSCSKIEVRQQLDRHAHKHLPAKAVLRLAYCLANNIRSEERLKFASGENSIKLLRSLGFQAERLQIDNPIAKKG